MKKCFICGKEAKHNETINVVTCECENCGTYAYEKNFLTTYDYYFSVNSKQKKEKVKAVLGIGTITLFGYEYKNK